MQTDASTIDTAEVEKFTKISSEWWNIKGKFRPLHQINPLRVAYIRDNLAFHYGPAAPAQKPLQGLKLLDIGCGGGLLSEPLTRLGAAVTAIDASARNISVAKLHAEQSGLTIDYHAATAEEWATEHAGHYHAVLAMEVIEHVADVPYFVASCAKLLAPGGMLFLSTINRTAKAYLHAIIGAEWILQWLPRGTHHWTKFLTPAEIVEHLRSQSLQIQDMKGLSFRPFQNEWHIVDTLGVNYMLAAVHEVSESNS